MTFEIFNINTKKESPIKKLGGKAYIKDQLSEILKPNNLNKAKEELLQEGIDHKPTNEEIAERSGIDYAEHDATLFAKKNRSKYL